LGKTVAELSRHCDSVMFCLSKGLGAPVGSMLAGSKEFIEKAHIARKMLGGGMRQAGVFAAAGLIALEESPKNLHRDHENAKVLAQGLAKIKGISLDAAKVVTNIVIFDVRGTGRTAAEICADLGKRKILCGPTDKYSIRMVTHCDVQRNSIENALAAMGEVLKVSAPAAAHS
jgi:threonine aldolase